MFISLQVSMNQKESLFLNLSKPYVLDGAVIHSALEKILIVFHNEGNYGNLVKKMQELKTNYNTINVTLKNLHFKRGYCA